MLIFMDALVIADVLWIIVRSFSFWALGFPFFLRLLITPLVSSNFSSGVIKSICPLRLVEVLLAGDH